MSEQCLNGQDGRLRLSGRPSRCLADPSFVRFVDGGRSGQSCATILILAISILQAVKMFVRRSTFNV